MINEIKKDAENRMAKSVAAFSRSLQKLRTGRAHPSLLQQVTVDYYGSQVPLDQTANISVEDSQTLSVTPWEQQMIPVIEKAIINSDLGLNPVTAGNIIRIPLPPLTQERRMDLAKLVRTEAETGKVAIRNVRRDALGDIKDLLKEKMISEDDERRAHQEIQALTDKYVAELEVVSEEKQSEIKDF